MYWFTDATGDVLYVGKATDLHSRVRSYFSGDTRNKVGRLLRQMDAVHHRVCQGPLTAEVLEGRLIRAWAPPFNRQGKVKRRDPGTRTAGGATPSAGSAGDGHTASPGGDARAGADAPGRPRTWPVTRPSCSRPFAERVVALSRLQRYEDAARVRDDAERLRHLVVRHRSVESLRRAGRLVLHVEGEGTVELDEGLLVESGTLFDAGCRPDVGHSGGLDPVSTVTADGHDNERLIVAQWLRANADKVRVLASDGR